MHPAWNFKRTGDTSIYFIVGVVVVFFIVGLAVYLVDRFNKKKDGKN